MQAKRLSMFVLRITMQSTDFATVIHCKKIGEQHQKMLTGGRCEIHIQSNSHSIVKTEDRQFWTCNTWRNIIPMNPLEDTSKGWTSANQRLLESLWQKNWFQIWSQTKKNLIFFFVLEIHFKKKKRERFRNVRKTLF